LAVGKTEAPIAMLPLA